MAERFSKWKKPVIRHGIPTKWNWLVLCPEGLTLGAHTDIGAYTLLVAKHGVEIEDEVQIGSHCSIYSYSTTPVCWFYKDWVSWCDIFCY